MDVEVNEKWTFRDLVVNAKMLKKQYSFCLAFFSYEHTYEELKSRNKIIKETRDKIYSLDMEEWKKDRVWEYMNGYEFYTTLKCILERLDNKRK